MNKLLITIAFVGLVLAVLYPIRGMFPPFYYQEFNALRNRLDNIDGLRDVLENLAAVIEFCSDQANPVLVPDPQYDYRAHLNYAQIEFL